MATNTEPIAATPPCNMAITWTTFTTAISITPTKTTSMSTRSTWMRRTRLAAPLTTHAGGTTQTMCMALAVVTKPFPTEIISTTSSTGISTIRTETIATTTALLRPCRG
jgi:hypothetical protein